MKEIELVVKIPEEEYEIIKNHTGPMTWVEHLVKDGTPLPKGHGALIDISNIDVEQCKWWVNHLFNLGKEQACNSHNFNDAEEIQAAQDKIIKILEQEQKAE